MQTNSNLDNFIFQERPRLAFPSELDIKDEVQDIESLMSHLRTGVLLGTGALGPNHYTVEPFNVGRKIVNHDLFGWARGAARVANVAASSFMIQGAEIIENRGYVYFSMNDLSGDSQLYVVSFDVFKQHVLTVEHPAFIIKRSTNLPPNLLALSSMHSPAPKNLTGQELAHIEWLCALPKYGTPGYKEASFKETGQRIFDQAKNAGQSGFAALQRIHRAVYERDRELANMIEHDWDGVGDDQKRWMA